MQLPQLAIDRTVTPITCNFEFVITDKQDKLIMFKHSQEDRRREVLFDLKWLVYLKHYRLGANVIRVVEIKQCERSKIVIASGRDNQSDTRNICL